MNPVIKNNSNDGNRMDEDHKFINIGSGGFRHFFIIDKLRGGDRFNGNLVENSIEKTLLHKVCQQLNCV